MFHIPASFQWKAAFGAPDTCARRAEVERAGRSQRGPKKVRPARIVLIELLEPVKTGEVLGEVRERAVDAGILDRFGVYVCFLFR